MTHEALIRRLYVELFHCDQQMMAALDEEGNPMWWQGATVRDVLTDAKTALETSPPQRTEQEPVAYLCGPDENGLFGLPTADKACKDCFPVYTALPQRTEQEPVKMIAYNCLCGRTMKFESVHGVVAPQRTWVGLTDEERSELVTLHHGWNEYGQAIEAKLKEKNT
jgi:hypothetical protein